MRNSEMTNLASKDNYLTVKQMKLHLKIMNKSYMDKLQPLEIPLLNKIKTTEKLMPLITITTINKFKDYNLLMPMKKKP
jgi:hypothetical protein